MAESTLSIAYAELIAEIGYVCGYGRTEASWSSTQASNVAQALKRGLRMFYVHPPVPGVQGRHEWRFLRPVTTSIIWPSFAAASTRLVSTANSGSNGVITAGTGTTFYALMVGKTITINSVDYTISAVVPGGAAVGALTVTSNTGTQTNQQWSMTTDGTYQAPDGFGGLIGKPTIGYLETTSYGPLSIVGEFDIRNRQQRDISTGAPKRIAIRSQTVTTTTSQGTRWEFIVDPFPDDVYTIRYQYRILPDLITSTVAYALGGSQHAQTLLEACLAAAEMVTSDVQGPHYAEFMRYLGASIEYDKSLTAQATFGYNGDGFIDDETLGRNPGLYITYNGVQY